MRTAKPKRSEGACVACARAKTKCDQLRPECSRCTARGLVCTQRTFKLINFNPTSFSKASKKRNRANKPTLAPDDETETYQQQSHESASENPSILRREDQELPSLERPSIRCPERRQSAQIDTVSSPSRHVLTPFLENSTSFRRTDPGISDTVYQASEATRSADSLCHVLESTPKTREHTSHFRPNLESPTLSTECVGTSPHIVTTSPHDTRHQANVQFLWQHFVDHTAKEFLVWDVRKFSHDRTIYDPYAVGLPAMATASLPMYYAALAISAFHYTKSTGDETLSALQSDFEQAAIQALANSQPQATKGSHHHLHTVTCIMLLCLCKPSEYTDLLPLARSAAACLVSDATRANLDGVQVSVAMMLMRWCEICVLCSPRAYAELSEEPIHHLIECTEDENSMNEAQTFKHWTIHPLYGFSHRLVKPLLKIARVARSRQNSVVLLPSGYLDEAEINALELELLEGRDADLAEISVNHKNMENLLHLNEAIYAAAVLIFYTRLRDMVWTSPLIRKLVDTTCTALGQLDRNSRASLAVLFPCYFVGCEVVDSSTRKSLLEQLGDLPKNWFSRASRTAQCLQHVWELRDMQPGKAWIAWSKDVSSEYADCIPC